MHPKACFLKIELQFILVGLILSHNLPNSDSEGSADSMNLRFIKRENIK